MGRKVHASFPADDDDRFRYLFAQCRVGPNRHGALQIWSLTSEPNALAIQAWLRARYDGYEISLSNNKQQKLVNYGVGFINVVEKRARTMGVTDSPFHRSLAAARTKAEAKQNDIEAHREALRQRCEERAGREGCVDCGTGRRGQPARASLHFDHMSAKTDDVSQMLRAGKWQAASKEVDDGACELRCPGHHRDATVARNQLKGRPRAPPSNDERREAKRAHGREHTAKRYAYGKQRLLKAKLALRACARCGRVCTAENARSFDCDHIDPSTKRSPMSCMTIVSDETFNAELKGCQLMCAIECHRVRTKEEHHHAHSAKRRKLEAAAQ